MNGPASLADSTVVVNSNLAKPSLLNFPTEILDKIFSSVDNPGLINLRLVSRSVCTITNRPFAVRNFASSHHVLTRHSFETLLAVTAHDIFGAYIRSIMFSPYRIVLDYLDPQDTDEDAEVDDSFIESGEFSDLLSRILANIRRHSESITIGVLEFYGEWGNVHRQRFHGEGAFKEGLWGGIVTRPSETFELVRAEMHAAGMLINGLHFNLSIARRFPDTANLKMYKVVTQFLQSCDSLIDLRFTWEENGFLEYNHLQSRLCFSAPSVTLDRARPDVGFVEETVRWLLNKSISDLYLQDLDVDSLPFFDVYLTQSLQTITLENIRLKSTGFAQNSYSALFRRLARMPNLKHCKFHLLYYNMSSVDASWAMRLVSGDYPSKWESLVLIFPTGRSEVEVRGTDISRQLEDLAAYTAAAEERKIHEVEAVGQLVGRRVMGADTPMLGEENFECPVSLRLPVIDPDPIRWTRHEPMY